MAPCSFPAASSCSLGSAHLARHAAGHAHRPTSAVRRSRGRYPREFPIEVVSAAGGDLSGITMVTTSIDHDLALRSDGTVWAWGDNVNGELGIGTSSNQGCACYTSALQVVGPGGIGALSGIIAVSAGGY